MPGSGSTLSTFLQSEIRNTTFTGIKISLVTGGAGNAVNNNLEKK